MNINLYSPLSLLATCSTLLMVSCVSSGRPETNASEPAYLVTTKSPAVIETSIENSNFRPEVQDEEEKTTLQKGTQVGKDAAKGAVDAGKGIVSLPGKAFSSLSTDEMPDLSKGRQELGLSGNLNFTDDTAYNFNFSYGYFFKKNWETGFSANAFGREDFNLGVGLFTEYNFSSGESKWVPFVGGSIQWARVSTGSNSDSSAAYGGELGIKYFIRSDVALFTSFDFQWSPDDVFGIGSEIEDSAQNLNFGIRFFL